MTPRTGSDPAADTVITSTGGRGPTGPTRPTGATATSEVDDVAGMKTARTGGVVRAGAVMAVATLVSRVTGFLSKVVLVSVLGFGIVNDAYTLANTLPNIVFELLIGGVLTSVAIPLLSRARSDRDGGALYTQRLMTAALVGLLIATALAVLAAPLLTNLYLSGDEGTVDQGLATALAYLLLPQIFFYGIAALFGAILNTKEKFGIPAWAPVANNLVVIGIGVAMHVMSSDESGGLTSLTREQYLVLGIGTTLGIVVQALVMLPALLRTGFRFRWRWGGDRRLLEAGGLMLWAVAYVLVSQAGYVVVTNVASANVEGGIGLYAFASMLFQLPYGIVGVSILTAIMPRMSRHAAAGQMDNVKDDAGLASRLSIVALTPIAAGIIVLASALAVVSSLYGKVDIDEALVLGTTLAALAFGLVPFAVTLVQMRVFYAMKDARTPTIINAIMVVVRVPLLLVSAAQDERLIIPAMAVGTSVSYLVGAIAGEIWLRARYGRMGTVRTLITLAKMTLAGAAGAVAALLVGNRLLHLEVEDLGDALVEILISGTVGLMVIAAVAVLLKVEELVPLRRRIAAMVRKVIRRGPPPGTNPPGAPSSTDAVTVALTLPSPLAGRMAPAGASAPGMSPRHGTLRGSSTSAYAPLAVTGSVDSADSAEQTVRLDTRAPRPNGPGGPDSQLDAPTETTRPREQVKGPVPSNSGGPAGRGVAEEELATPSDVTIDSPNRETGGVATGGTGADDDATRVLSAEELAAANEPPPLFADDEAGLTMPTTSSGGVADGGAGSEVVTAAVPLTPGTTIGGRYRLVSLVSADAAGHWFWRAKDTVLPRDMAVTILPDTTGASATVARTLRAGRLHHIGLPQTLDVGTDHGQSYVVGQWVDGATLTDLLSAGPLEPDVATSITAKISEAVAEAHRNGIALGAINPSLIRVNFDGQVRFSHVIAHGSATPDQDIRAVGALLYLMLTGTWPLPEPLDPLAMAGRTVASIPPSPTSLGRELPADEVRPGVPEALSALAERALHPDEPDGIHAVGAIAALLRSPETVGHAEAATAPQDRPLSAGDRRLIRERRVKVSLAAVVLAVFAVLIVIAIGGLAKQFLASVENSAPDDVKMIDSNTPPSAQPAAPAPAPDAATSGGQPTSAAAPAGAPVPIVAGQVYDPQGDGKPDYKAYVDRAYDGNADSAWLTWVYKQQFPSLKTGVGLNLELEKETTPTSVQITSATPGTKVEIRSSTGPTVPLQQTTVLGSGTVTDKPLTIPLTAAPKSKYLLVFVTGMAPSADKQFQSKINEITVTGS
jgi:putative peptidoglycan lipid II flippase